MNVVKFKPSSKPQAKLTQLEQFIQHIDRKKYPCVLVGSRGYYRDSMGKPYVNDRMIYDDAIFLITPTCYMSFNANTDPGAFRKRIANLKAGTWMYKLGIHGLSKAKHLRYKALVQAADVTVVRDEVGEDTGRFAINIHRGGQNKVSSLGCQTIVPEQWQSFITTLESEMKRYNQSVIPYRLIEEVV